MRFSHQSTARRGGFATTSARFVWASLTPLLFVAVLLGAQASLAASGTRSETSNFFRCQRPTDGPMSDPAIRRQVRFDADLDAYHGAAFLIGGGAIQLAGSPTRRWSGSNGLDEGIREGFRGGSPSARQDADMASDLTLALAAGVLPMASIGAQFMRNHDCLETWDMATDWVESLGLTLFITQATKLASGRDRPRTKECDGSPPRDAGCGNDDRHLSFFSGHASLAAAGAGLTCSFSLGRKAWGSSRSARFTPCALGITATLATGALRMTADRHWGTDVFVGFAVGAVVGYFDTWGPLDLLRFKTRDTRGRVSSNGMLLPFAQDDRLGAQVVMIF